MLLKKITYCGLLLVLMSSTAFAETRKSVDIKEATVFLNGAELFSTARVTLNTGENEILFTNIADRINIQSLNVGADNGAVVQSATFRNNYLQDEALSPRAQEIKDSIEYLQNERNLNKNKILSVEEQIAVIKKNQELGGKDKAMSVSELQQLLALVKANMNKLLDEQTALQADDYKLAERTRLLQQQLQEEKQRGYQPGGQVLVKFYAKKATTANVTITYVMQNAGWTPTYDLRVEDVNQPVKLGYKAHVYQSSGISWDKVKLTLSTGNPSQGAEAPVLNPWYINYYAPKPIAYTNRLRNNQGYASGAAEEKLAIADALQAYEPSESNIGDYVQIDNSGINTIFDIDLPYSIPSDGKQVTVAIKTEKLPATYRHYAVPKMDRDAFLQAQITGWEELNLLPAQTNIFFEGTYVGQGYIDVRNVKDTFNISLGRDKKVVVRRERNTELRSVKTIGTNVREEFEYKITVRNTRGEKVSLYLLDQMPISNDKSIEVNDLKYSGGNYNSETGIVNWNLQLNPNETKEVRLGYTVKYPKGKQINL